MTYARDALITDFARWIAFASLRSNAPVRSSKEAYSALDSIDFTPLFDTERGAILDEEFSGWHESATARMCLTQPKLNVGWAAKMINEYLKTKCYVAGYGRRGLIEAIHPPIDNGLARGLRKAFSDRDGLREDIDSLVNIGDMNEYAQYEGLIGVCRRVARLEGCLLMESEMFWD